jgi:branched-subunit amino acid transport protein AzlD
MGLGWDFVLKLGAFGACLMVAILVISYFVGVSYDSFWFSFQLIVAVLFVIAILVSWNVLKRVTSE